MSGHRWITGSYCEDYSFATTAREQVAYHGLRRGFIEEPENTSWKFTDFGLSGPHNAVVA
jgi:hypothetical protein